MEDLKLGSKIVEREKFAESRAKNLSRFTDFAPNKNRTRQSEKEPPEMYRITCINEFERRRLSFGEMTSQFVEKSPPIF